MRLALASLLVLASPLAAAQGRWLDTFAVPGVFDGGVTGAAVHAVVPDGASALVGGTFRLVGDIEANGVARWTGAAWEAFGGGLRRNPDSDGVPYAATANAVVRASDGSVWVAGRFDAVVQPDGSELPASGLARWTGAAWEIPGRLVGEAFVPPTGYALAVAGGSVVVAGEFADLLRPDGTALGGSGVVRWTSGVWESLGERERTFALAVLPDGSVAAPATVATPDGNGAVAVVRLNGSASEPVTGVLDGPFSVVRSLLVDGGQIYVGGQFTGGLAANGDVVVSSDVIRWDGATWQPLGRGVAGSEVNALAADAAGSLLVGGRLNGGLGADGTLVASPGLVRWTGAAWERRALSDRGGPVLALARAGSETLAGGRFEAVGGTGDATRRAVNVAALPAGGGLRPLSARTGRDGTVSLDGSGLLHQLTPDGCGGVHVFTDGNAGPLPSGVVRTWNGAAWEPVPDGIRAATFLTAFPGSPFVTYGVNDLAAVPGSCDAFVLAGLFGGVDVNGVPVESPNVVRWTGQSWQPLGRGTDGVLEAIAVGPDGAVTIGGRFSTVFQADGAALPVRNVARWTEGGGWTALGGGVRPANTFPDGVFALLAEANGAVVVGGRFDTAVEADGTARPARNVARWTGTTWETFGGPTPDGPFPVSVSGLARWQGHLVVSGNFAQVQQPGGAILDARAVAAWDGAAWGAFPGLDTNAGDLALGDGELFVAAGLGFGAARWTGSTWAALDPARPTGGFRLAFAARSLYLSGGFETAGGIGSPGLAEFDLDAIVAAEPVATASRPGGIAVAPNPSRASTALTFRLDAPGPVRLTLVDALGRAVAVLADGERAAGEHTVRVDTSRLPAGVYVARLVAGGVVRTQQLTVVR